MSAEMKIEEEEAIMYALMSKVDKGGFVMCDPSQCKKGCKTTFITKEDGRYLLETCPDTCDGTECAISEEFTDKETVEVLIKERVDRWGF